jgi:threonine dehydrogenase-like Zn-dependent dehydrogenase
MKGFAMKRIGEVGWVEKDAPKCGPLDAICRPIALAPCTSDIHTVYEGALGEREDMILGHEAVGEIVEVGELVNDFKVGDKVLVPAITPDWGALESQRGFAMHSGGMLSGWKFSNFKDGVFGELFHVNEADANLALLPEGMDPATGTMLSDMVPTGFHGAEMAEVTYGEDVLVVGIGPVGLMAVAGSALKGAARILAVGTRPNCIEVAKEYGATDIISYKEGPIEEQVMSLTRGKGVDKVILAGGGLETFKTGVKVIKPGGIISNINYLGSGENIEIPRVEWGVGMGHIKIVGGLMPAGRMRTERLANLIMAGRLDPSKLLTHRFEEKGFL